VKPVIRPRQGAHQDQAAYLARAGQGHFLGHHAAQRQADQVRRRQVQGVQQSENVGR
jgi:hypothetical protein